jgi:preprotein translocase subunit SecY
MADDRHGAARPRPAAVHAALRGVDRVLLLLLHGDRVQSEDTADNLKKHGGFIPGIRPGERTAQYIDYVLTRITVVGAIYITSSVYYPNSSFPRRAFRSISVAPPCLIVVSVTMDTVSQIQGHLLAHQYEGTGEKIEAQGEA